MGRIVMEDIKHINIELKSLLVNLYELGVSLNADE